MIKKYQVFKETIKTIIQESGLDIGVIYFILKDIFTEIEILYYSQLNKEIMSENVQVSNNEDTEVVV